MDIGIVCGGGGSNLPWTPRDMCNIKQSYNKPQTEQNVQTKKEQNLK